MDVFVCLLLSSPPRPNAMSAVFDFNASLNDVVPASPMPLPVDVLRKRESELLIQSTFL